MTRNKTVFLLLGTSVLFFAVVLTRNNSLIGAVLGYWIGFLYTQWLHRDAQSSIKLDTSEAVRRLRRSFVKRLGFVTLTVVIVGRFFKGWLFSLALGIALGLLVSLILGVIEFIKKERGEL
ncbi:hypothetical protein ACHOLT_04165 [Desulfitobacterium sp. Sab5]|uniref:hypothetical protein n=1 Tax=Desulfitobacterium nosdiversum TaxID=3375356 RepID=UPI003CF1C0C6